MNRSIRKVSIAIAVLFLALFVNLNVVQIVEGDHYRDNSGNARVHYNEYSSPRGAIIVNGRSIADSVEQQDSLLKYVRKYSDPELYSSVTGYFPFNGSPTQIEAYENDILSGDSDKLFTSKLADILTGRGLRGGSVTLTINPAVQKVAYNAMKDEHGKIRAGAIVALDPTTGAILADISTPSFNPGVISGQYLPDVAHYLGCYQALSYPLQGTHESLKTLATRTAASLKAQLVLRAGGSTKFLASYLKDTAHFPLGDDVYAADPTKPNTQTLTWTPYISLDNLEGARGANASVDRQLESAYQAQFRAHGVDFDSSDGQFANGVSGCADTPDDPTPTFTADHQAPSPLENTSFYQRYFAGSIFTIIDSAAALERGTTPTTSIPAPNGYRPYDESNTSACPASLDTACVENFDGEQCGNGKTATLILAFEKSCNTAFAQLAVDKITASGLEAEAKKFGFGTTSLFSELPPPYSSSTVGDPAQLASDKGYLAQSAFGQRDVQVTPILAALMSAAVANNGTMMKPYLVKSEQRPDLTTLDTTQPAQYSQVIDASLAPQLQQLMEAVVNGPSGVATGTSAKVTDFGSAVVTAGKTGTADTGATSASKIQPDAWFTGYATYRGQPKIAVAVLLEHAGVNGDEITGGEAAGPVAKAVMTAYLHSIGAKA